MREHLNLNKLALRTSNILLDNRLMHHCNLLKRQLTSQHNHICPLRVELYSLTIGDIALCRDMYLNTHLICIEDYRQIRCNNSIYTLLLSSVDHRVHQCQLCVVDNRIDCKVGLYSVFVRNTVNLRHIVSSEVSCRS